MCSVVSDSLGHFGHTRLLWPWVFPGKNTVVNRNFLTQGIFPTQGSNPCLLHLLHWQADSLPTEPPGKPFSCNNVIQLDVIVPIFWIKNETHCSTIACPRQVLDSGVEFGTCCFQDAYISLKFKFLNNHYLLNSFRLKKIVKIVHRVFVNSVLSFPYL